MKKILIGVCALAVIAIIAFVYKGAQTKTESLATDDAQQQMQTETQTAPTTAVSDSVTGSDSLQALLGLGKTQKCSFTTTDTKVATEGTAYFNNGMMRVDTSYTGTDTVAQTSNLIINGDTMYTWAQTAKGTFAMKMPTASIQTAGTGNAETTHDGEVSLQNKVQYNCAPWSVDESVFVPPANITFMDMSNMMNNIPASLKASMPVMQ